MTCSNPLCNDGWVGGLVAGDTVVEERCPACRVPASLTHSGDAPPAPAAPAEASTAPAARAEGGAPGHDTVVICGDTRASCHCALPPGHTGDHRCVPHCGGVWRYVDGAFTPVSMPGGQSVREALDEFYGLLFGGFA